MSNPYQPPGASSATVDPGTFADDPELNKLKFRRRVCGIVVGFVLIPLGVVALTATLNASTQGYAETSDWRLWVAGAAGTAMLVVGVNGIRRKPWAVYAAAILATLWIGRLAYCWHRAPQDAETQLFSADELRAFLAFEALPAALILVVAELALVVEVFIQRRRGVLNVRR